MEFGSVTLKNKQPTHTHLLRAREGEYRTFSSSERETLLHRLGSELNRTV
jgi:hypothetical protein